MQKRFTFEELGEAPLIIDAIYEGGKKGSFDDDPISKVLKVGNQAGFRPARKDTEGHAYIVLFTTGGELEWPDKLNIETGIFRYYGDNRKPGQDLHYPPGNKLLRDYFNLAHGTFKERKRIPPFFIFQTTGTGRDVKFLGLAAPGGMNISPMEELTAVWKTKGTNRFQNYLAYFTVLDLHKEPISRKWIIALKEKDFDAALELAPNAWKDFVNVGISEIQPLIAPKVREYRTTDEQLPKTKHDWAILNCIYNYFTEDPFAFEACAARLVEMMDRNYGKFDLTQPWRDGGRDAIGTFYLGPESDRIMVDCALEAKCHNPTGKGVGVKDMSRLISRIKHRQFGIMVTTSYVAKQAYEEVKEDKHPIVIISGMDLVDICKNHDLDTVDKLDAWLKNQFQITNKNPGYVQQKL